MRLGRGPRLADAVSHKRNRSYVGTRKMALELDSPPNIFDDDDLAIYFSTDVFNT